jgi:hypothetical protein
MEKAVEGWSSSKLEENSSRIANILKLDIDKLEKCFKDSFVKVDQGEIV